MKRGKKIADELQYMFAEGRLKGFDERYINIVAKKLWTGSMGIEELIELNPDLKETVAKALSRMNRRNPY